MPFVQLLKYQKTLVFNHSIFDHVHFGSSQTGQYIHTHTHTQTHTPSTELRLLYTLQMIKSTVLPGSHEFRLSMTAKYVCKMVLFYLILTDLLKGVIAEKETLIRGILKTSMLEHLQH